MMVYQQLTAAAGGDGAAPGSQSGGAAADDDDLLDGDALPLDHVPPAVVSEMYAVCERYGLSQVVQVQETVRNQHRNVNEVLESLLALELFQLDEDMEDDEGGASAAPAGAAPGVVKKALGSGADAAGAAVEKI
jgi:hypothetical protein